MLLRDHTIYVAETITPLGLPQDFVSNQLIAVSGGMADKRPFQTSSDGNCLFNSASIATFGDQFKAAELRVLTCLEMLDHSDYYERQHKTTGLHLVTQDYNEAVVDCAIDGNFSCAWTIHALSSVLKIPIRSVYPSVNGLLDNSIPILNTVFKPRVASKKAQPIFFMWTSTGSHTRGTWTPDDFVPLLSVECSMPLNTTYRKRSYSEVLQDNSLSPKRKVTVSTPTHQENRHVKFQSFDFNMSSTSSTSLPQTDIDHNIQPATTYHVFSDDDDFQPTTSNQNLSTVPTADSNDEFQPVNTSDAAAGVNKSPSPTPGASNFHIWAS
jgi:hypothetical protein